MGRRGRSTTIGKFAKIHHDRRVSEIRLLGDALRGEQRANSPNRGADTTKGHAPTRP